MDYNPLLFKKRHRFISFNFCFVLWAFQLADLGEGGGGGWGSGAGGIRRGKMPPSGIRPLADPIYQLSDSIDPQLNESQLENLKVFLKHLR